MDPEVVIDGRSIESNQESSPRVDIAKERKAHIFRAEKRASFPDIRAALSLIRADPGIWERVELTSEEQRKLEKNTSLPGETHRIGAALFASIYRNPEAASLYDTALFRATQEESRFFKERIQEGNDYLPVTIFGVGGVYGTIFSAALLKADPDNPPFGFDAGKRRGGIWGVSGDVTLDKPWWRMNSRSRPEDRNIPPVPGGEGNLNSLGAETQNLQVPDISSGQYPTNNEMGRVLSHDNFHSNNAVFDARLVKVRPNRTGKQGEYEQEFEDTETGKRFLVYTDKVMQATGLGREDLGFSDKFDMTQEVIEQTLQELKSGVKTPRLLTFLQLVEATTGNRDISPEEFARFGLIGKGDTSKVIREFFAGIGGIDPGFSAQEGFVKQIIVFGLGDETRENLRRSERARYVEQLLEFGRQGGGFFRFQGVEGRVVGVGIPQGNEGIIVYIKRVDDTPEGKVVTYGREIVPRLVTAAGFIDESDKIYSGLTAELVAGRREISTRLEDAVKLIGSTIYYTKERVISSKSLPYKAEIESVSRNGRLIKLAIVDKDGYTQSIMIDKDNLSQEEKGLLDPAFISKLEIPGEPPRFQPFILKEFDDQIPVAEKADGFEIYKIGACTNYPLTDKERARTKAFEQIPENTKSIFRYVEAVKAFGFYLAGRVDSVEGALNLTPYKVLAKELEDFSSVEKKLETLRVPVLERALSRRLPQNLRAGNLFRLLAESVLNCAFPEGMEEIKIGVKRLESSEVGDEGKSLTLFAVQFDPPLPDTENWSVFRTFFNDELVQRVLLQVTRNKSTQSAEARIALKNRIIDVRNTTVKSIKNSEGSGFRQRYPVLAS